ncbi:hypothetical protein CfE428DRAFT_0148 [Chthoniobacter flavus Ellin428]|uniref:Uncharacterized protein n=1 Tax=Chthoniobacter flavus Ellin428 TaxID=497964 RepID=B4CTY5_9BACT|nr:hypothetical protein CfE428DRAFT_0148 [Chthoniobacter flavus Ellin428]TCO89410.1 hypothetical protein EV701_114144 [Chthoniobacter flavus]
MVGTAEVLPRGESWRGVKIALAQGEMISPVQCRKSIRRGATAQSEDRITIPGVTRGVHSQTKRRQSRPLCREIVKEV